MNIQEKLAQIRTHQVTLAQATSALDASLKEAEVFLQELLREKLKKFNLEGELDILLCFRGGCHTVKWSPEYYIYHIRGDRFNSSCWVYVDGKWAFVKHYDDDLSKTSNFDFEKQLDPTILNSLEAFCAELRQESGLRVNLGNNKLEGV